MVKVFYEVLRRTRQYIHDLLLDGTHFLSLFALLFHSSQLLIVEVPFLLDLLNVFQEHFVVEQLLSQLTL